MAPQAQNVTSAAPAEPVGFGFTGGQIGFFGVTPVAQPSSPSGNTHTVAAGSTTAVFVNTSFDGGITGTAYTIGDIVAALKNLGLIAV